jgi:hypothetical protein
MPQGAHEFSNFSRISPAYLDGPRVRFEAFGPGHGGHDRSQAL